MTNSEAITTTVSTLLTICLVIQSIKMHAIIGVYSNQYKHLLKMGRISYHATIEDAMDKLTTRHFLTHKDIDLILDLHKRWSNYLLDRVDELTVLTVRSMSRTFILILLLICIIVFSSAPFFLETLLSSALFLSVYTLCRLKHVLDHGLDSVDIFIRRTYTYTGDRLRLEIAKSYA